MVIPAEFARHWRHSGLRPISMGSYEHHQQTLQGQPRPAHNHWVLHCMLHGSSTLSLPHGEVQLAAPAAILTRPDEGYTQDLQPDAGKLWWLSADFDVMTQPGYDNALASLAFPAVVTFPHAQAARLISIAQALPGNETADRRFLLRPLLDQLLTLFCQEGFATGQLRMLGGHPPRWFADLQRIMSTAEFLKQNNLKFGSLTKASGVNRNQLCRAFRQHCGCSPMAWIRRERMTNAARQLVNRQDLPIAAIAANWGYASFPLFCRHFRQVMGCSASAWRQEGRSAPA